MKKILLIAIFFVSAFFMWAACPYSDDGRNLKCINQHGEYFCTEGKDTSAYSFRFSENPYHHDVNVFFDLELSYKMFQYEQLGDRQKELYNKTEHPVRFSKRFYDEMLEEFAMCLKNASCEITLDSLKEIDLNLADLGDCSVDIMNNYLKICPQKPTPGYYQCQFYKDVCQAICQTDLKSRLDSILKDYHIQVDSFIFDDEYHENISKKKFLRKNKVKSQNVPSELINGFCTVKCRLIK